MANPALIVRFTRPRLLELLADTPVVLVHGPRQCGKTTLARSVEQERAYAYYTFDDDNLLAAVQADPVGFVAELPPRVILDEVQRVPGLFTSLKASVDRDRKPGRFLLAGSANVLLLPKLSDSLAGRIDVLRLHPLAQCEIAGKESGFLDALFKSQFRVRKYRRLGEQLIQRVVSGGYPAALQRATPRRRREWYLRYIDALVQRDVRDMSRISALDALPRLLATAAAQTACLANIAELAAPFQLSRPTIRDYVTLLERVFLLELLPPWHSNRLSRLIKTPKLHLGDAGLAAALLDVDAADLSQNRPLFGHLLETFVFQELRRQSSWHEQAQRFHHFRDKDGHEVDIVIEQGTAIAGVEVKASSTIVDADFRGLRRLRDATGKRFAAGVVLYDGEHVLRFDERLFAVPIEALWTGE